MARITRRRAAGAMVVVLATTLLSATGLRADAPPAPSANPEPSGRVRLGLTRAALAVPYLRADHAFAAALAKGLAEGEARERYNRQFDRATIEFFSGRRPQAERLLNELVREIEAGLGREIRPDVAVASKGTLCEGAATKRELLLERARKVEAPEGLARLSREIVLARLALMTERPDPNNSASFLGEWACAKRTEHFERQVALLEAGEWRGAIDADPNVPLVLEGSTIPMRVVAPEGKGEPRPVVVALHGAGGDEAMFATAYGAGALVRACAERGAILVTPRTELFGFLPDAMERLLAQLDTIYGVDRERVFLIGHSLGAQAALGLARRPAPAIRGVVLIAGGRGLGAGDGAEAGNLPPVLMIVGGLDPIFPLDGLVQDVQRAQAKGVRVELRVFQHDGHTLVVTPGVERAMEWFGGLGLAR